MALQRSVPTAGTAHGAMPAQPGAPGRELLEPGAPVVRDLRGRTGHGPYSLDFTPGDIVVVSGLPGGGKSTLIRQAVSGPAIDSQDTRDRWAAALPPLLPYALYRPLVRAAHYLGLWAVLRSGASVVVHDCGTQAWVRRWLALHAARRGRTLHLLLLDVDPATARQGQRERGRGV
ncbi:AAA family ATPase, partial [Streptomyces cyaneofuscatus]